MTPVLNDTKWNELRLGMYELKGLRPRWRTKDLSGYLSHWDGDWYYHFQLGGYASIEWVELQTTSPEQWAAVLAVLRQIRLPGEKLESGFRIYGHTKVGAFIDYL